MGPHRWGLACKRTQPNSHTLDLSTGRSALLTQTTASGHRGIEHWICYHKSICRSKSYKKHSIMRLYPLYKLREFWQASTCERNQIWLPTYFDFSWLYYTILLPYPVHFRDLPICHLSSFVLYSLLCMTKTIGLLIVACWEFLFLIWLWT